MEQSVEEIVRTSDEKAVRMQFDERNLAWFRSLLILSLIYAIVAFLVLLGRNHPVQALDPAINIAMNAILLVALRDDRASRPLGSFIRAHVPAVIIATMTVQTILGLALGARAHDAQIPWSAIFPWFMTGFRMASMELTLLHGSLAAVSVINALLMTTDAGPMAAVALTMNVCALVFSAMASRRRRREILKVWRERKSHASEVVRMRDELQYAREIQLSMLPEAPPDLGWVDVAGVSIPATEVGGDYYDYFVVGERLAIVCGDVSGHGLAAGIVLASIRSGFTLLRDALTDPARVLRQLHDLVRDTSRRRTLVTCSVVLLDREARKATIASAGHPPVILRSGESAEPVELYAPPLGVRLPFEIPRREVAIAPGDILVLHSDGVYESIDAHGATYGIDRIVSVVSQNGHANAAELRDAIVRDVEQFRGSGKQLDDVTVVVARIVAC